MRHDAALLAGLLPSLLVGLLAGLLVGPLPAGAAPAADPPPETPPAAEAGAPAGSPRTEAERAAALWHHRNLGKALYESPATQYDAVGELRKALALAPDSARERVNLGLALLRAGKTDEGIAELEKAQKQDPSIPHTWFNLGIAFKRQSEYDQAITQLEGMAERVPDEPITHYNLGVLYRLQGQPERALQELETATRLDPRLAGPHFQLATAYRQAGRTEEAEQEMATFRELKAAGSGQEDLEWSWYSELYDTVEPEAQPAPGATPRFTAETLGMAGSGPADASSAATVGLILLAADGDDRPDLLAWSDRGIRLFPGGERAAGDDFGELGSLREVRAVAAGDLDNDGLDDLLVISADGVSLWANRSGAGRAGSKGAADEMKAAAGADEAGSSGAPDQSADSDRSGGSAGPSAPHGGAHFERLTGALPSGASADAGADTAAGADTSNAAATAASPAAPAKSANPWADRAVDRAVWLDVDHDYDLDLLLLGPEPAFLRNDGDGTFSDRTDRFPFVALGDGVRVTAAARIDVQADSQATNLVVAASDGSATLYRDLLGGVYEARPLPALASGLSTKSATKPGATRQLLAADVDHDGWTDLVATGPGSVTVLRNDHQEGFEAVAVPDGDSQDDQHGGGPIALLDLDNRGAGDLAVGDMGTGAIDLLWDRGRGTFEPSGHSVAAAVDLEDQAGRATRDQPSAAFVADLTAADLDGDGRTDLAAIDGAGVVRVLTNATETSNHWLRIGLTGVKNPRLAHGAEIEVKADTLYQKRLYDGVPIVVGLGDRTEADTVRITWPNGLIQNEIRQPADTFQRYREAPRLSGSCPMIFTWNGKSFQFITDVLGVAPLGASAGDGTYFPVDHDEGIRIPGSALARRNDGRYEIRVTEELREVAFLDEIRLAAVDHPADVEILTNDKFKGPPFPEHRLYGASRPLHPVAAIDGRGRDVHERLAARDAVYPDGFARHPDGMADLHTLTLDFGPEAYQGRALLVLSGWVDWADGSTFLAASQGSGPDHVGLELPSLQVQDASGRWVTVLDDMGIPAGKPKTIAVDLTGLLPAGWHKLRIVTSLCVYWDEIYLSPDPDPPTVHRTEIPLDRADLHFRGFSRVVIHPERKQPERFLYAERRPSTGAIEVWNPTPGLYTRYGAVGELLRTLDDRFVVMGSGDEVRMVFDPSDLPPVPAGWTRDFLLLVDGWAKDADANTAYSQTIEPLPYHGMPQYPYEAPNAYPDDPLHTLYREHYLTRPALRLFRPLTEGLAPAARADKPDRAEDDRAGAGAAGAPDAEPSGPTTDGGTPR